MSKPDYCPKCGHDRNNEHERDGSQLYWCDEETVPITVCVAHFGDNKICGLDGLCPRCAPDHPLTPEPVVHSKFTARSRT